MSSLAVLAGTVFVAGLFFAPRMIVAMTLVERLLPAQRLTEGLTWLLAGLNVGVAASGQAVEGGGVPAGFSIAPCADAVVLLVALWDHARLGVVGASEASPVHAA